MSYSSQLVVMPVESPCLGDQM